MIFEEKIAEIYTVIATQIDKMIPVIWSKFIFYGEINKIDYSGEVYFYFKSADNPDTYIKSLDISDIYGVDNKKIKEDEFVLYKRTVELFELFIKNDQDPWFDFVMSVNEDRKIKAHFDYIDWNAIEYYGGSRRAYFKSVYLGIDSDNPKEVQDVKNMKEYVATHKNDIE